MLNFRQQSKYLEKNINFRKKTLQISQIIKKSELFYFVIDIVASYRMTIYKTTL